MAEIHEIAHKPAWKLIDPDRPTEGYRCVHEGAAGVCGRLIYRLTHSAPVHIGQVKVEKPASLPGTLAESLAKALLDLEQAQQSLAARDADLVQAQANARAAIELREHADRENDRLRERVVAAEKNARDYGFEVARLLPLAVTTQGWKAKAAQLEVELAVLRAHVMGVDDWLEQHIESADWEVDDKQRRGRVDRWDQGWGRALKLARERLRAGQHPAYEVDNGCECGGACPNCARWGCETCCDGEMPSAHGSRDGSVQTFDYDDLRRHLVSAHRHGGALGLSDYEAMNEHDHEHRGPGTIRNHDVDSRDWSQDRIDETIAELKQMEGGAGV